MAYLPALIVVGAALLVLVLMLLALIGPVRRFRSAVRDYRARLDTETTVLHAARDRIRDQLDVLKPSRHGRNDG